MACFAFAVTQGQILCQRVIAACVSVQYRLNDSDGRTMTILLTTLNARYAHAALGLRYLLANMGELTEQTTIQEFVIGLRPTDIVEKILAHRQPDQKLIVGFGVYIWNVIEITQIVAILKQVAPEVVIILGGPEVSHETDKQEIIRLADYVITGWGDITFADLCRQILNGPKPLMKVHAGAQPPLTELKLPYQLYSDTDIRHRTLYVEASRGCPFKCEFCLSSLDKTAWPFDIDQFLAEMESLYQRGARLFKFVDRTFNLNIKTSLKIMQFFLDKLEANPADPVFAHFEVVPDHLPDALKEGIRKFPEGTLQFEIGIQSFNPEVQSLISRKQNNQKAAENIRWLCTESHAHLHVDLIAGLPGETMESFGKGFDHLVAVGPHEIQFGILKRLRGTPIIRHTDEYALRFDPQPPYTILENRDIPFADMQRLVRFARYWDMVANSGRFANTLPVMLGDAPFARFMAFSDWIFANTDATHRIALDRLAALVSQWLQQHDNMPAEEVKALLAGDYAGSAQHQQGASHKGQQAKEAKGKSTPQRQRQHLAA
ncbi:hypothetical protein GCM10010946_17480 [Undibacterium squillarum]|uniref:Radical SAM superfamily enzyme YgiQ (UPF0313 family) n=2 Tax=Undibacterium squillarum TaxID=1131567 RepID=A0ABQ2XXR2_9BURK|nr:hypothetical protein GCM10010946_17480 [Undibacterium squillarum]